VEPILIITLARLVFFGMLYLGFNRVCDSVYRDAGTVKSDNALHPKRFTDHL
jgi:hypothetical protein